MRTFMGVFMALIVSGNDEMTITGVLEESVLLPCTCSERSLDRVVRWQMEEPKETLVLKYNNTTLNIYGRYEGRVKILLPESRNNCSVLLTNITVDDEGKYRCCFYSQEKYSKVFVNLNVSARYDVCQKEGSSNVFQCDVHGRYPKAEIRWNLDGQLLKNSSTTHITHTNTPDARTGLYHFTSKLFMKLTGTSKPACDVKAIGAPAVMSYDCGATTETRKAEDFTRYRCVKIIPLILVLVFALDLWRRWKFSQMEVEGSGD